MSSTCDTPVSQHQANARQRPLQSEKFMTGGVRKKQNQTSAKMFQAAPGHSNTPPRFHAFRACSQLLVKSSWLPCTLIKRAPKPLPQHWPSRGGSLSTPVWWWHLGHAAFSPRKHPASCSSRVFLKTSWFAPTIPTGSHTPELCARQRKEEKGWVWKQSLPQKNIHLCRSKSMSCSEEGAHMAPWPAHWSPNGASLQEPQWNNLKRLE